MHWFGLTKGHYGNRWLAKIKKERKDFLEVFCFSGEKPVYSGDTQSPLCSLPFLPTDAFWSLSFPRWTWTAVQELRKCPPRVPLDGFAEKLHPFLFLPEMAILPVLPSAALECFMCYNFSPILGMICICVLWSSVFKPSDDELRWNSGSAL